MKAQNCLTVKSLTECATCLSSKGLEIQTVDGATVKSCVDKPIISNCTLITESSPFKCLRCDSLSYLSNDACVLIDSANSIPQCKYYKNSSTCEQCISPNVLSTDGKKCNSYAITSNCDHLIEPTNPICSTCLAGFEFQGNSCVTHSNKAFNKGCALFNYVNKTECLACVSSYYQYTDGNCYENGKSPGNSTNNNNTNLTNPTSGEMRY